MCEQKYHGDRVGAPNPLEEFEPKWQQGGRRKDEEEEEQEGKDHIDVNSVEYR